MSSRGVATAPVDGMGREIRGYEDERLNIHETSMKVRSPSKPDQLLDKTIFA